jgi:hypothetical protein
LKERKPVGVMEKYSKRRKAWTQFDIGKTEEAKILFSASKTSTFDQLQMLLQLLNENKIEFFRAPYLAFGQVRTLHSFS